MTTRTDYPYQHHVDYIQILLDHLNLTDITLFCQDYNGLIGFHLATNNSLLFNNSFRQKFQ